MPIKYETLEVLAGAYRGRNREAEGLTHTMLVQLPTGGEVVLCRRVRVEHLADRFANPGGVDKPPTCQECLRRDPRFKPETI